MTSSERPTLTCSGEDLDFFPEAVWIRFFRGDGERGGKWLIGKGEGGSGGSGEVGGRG